jgi:hypothetical protein
MADRLVIGPLLTHGGFKTWFLACCATKIVAVPGGFWVTLRASLFGMPYGLIGGVVAALTHNKRNRGRIDQLVVATEPELDAEPGRVEYPVQELASITCTRLALGHPEVILKRKDGTRRIHGMPNPLEFHAIANALRERYPDLAQPS